MIQFPETAQREWDVVALKHSAAQRLRVQVARDTQVANEVERLHVRHEAKLQFQRELDEANTPPLEMHTAAEYLSMPNGALSDLIEGVVRDRGICTVMGPSGAGKTSIALQLIHSAMTGADFLTMKAHKIKGAVGILSYDADAALLVDWIAGAPGMDLTKVSIVNAYRQGNPLGVVEQRKQIATAWRNMGVEIVLVDSFSASFFGTSQNDATETMSHYRDLKQFILTEVGASVGLVLAHTAPGSPRKARGSTVHHDAVDTILGIHIPDSASATRRVEMVKYRAGRGQAEMPPLLVTKPDVVTHLVQVDVAAMQLASMDLPAGVAFAPVPEPENEPDTNERDDEE